MEALLSAGLDHGRTEIIGITQDQDLDPGGGIELPHELSRQLGGLLEGDAYGRTRLFFHREPDTPREQDTYVVCHLFQAFTPLTWRLCLGQGEGLRATKYR
jgi:hypothetical protein